VTATPQAAGLLLASGDQGDFTVVNDFARTTGWLHTPLAAYASDGVALFAVLLIVGYLLARTAGRPLTMARALLAAATAPLLAVAVNQPNVHTVNEARPYTQLPHALFLVHRSVDASFPSDHAAMAGAVGAGLLCVHRNLGDNALTHTRTHITLGLHHDDTHAVLTITDDGPGIARNDRERIFARFSRLDTARTRTPAGGGAGLGLAISRQIAQRHHGSITVNDSPTTTFTVRLPLPHAAPTEGPDSAPRPAA